MTSPEQTKDTGPVDPCLSSPYKQTFDNDTVSVSCTSNSNGTRAYTLSTTHSLRDNDPASKQVQFTERNNTPSLILRSGNVMFDALFAMAIEETWQNSVSAVQDGSFNNNQPVTCACYQTGAKWTWAWTRDTAYAIDLAFASFDPQRSVDTLLFKISPRKASAGGQDTQIVQDTGTGGSWPVSSDRVVWALGARRVAQMLAQSDRQSFVQKAYPALANTIELDRKMIFDPGDGLYRGEQSFLDWREQSYPSWTKEQLWHIAMSKALSTNVTHLIAIELAASFAKDLGKTQEETKYTTWANALRKAIQNRFYLPSVGLYSTMITTTLDPAAVYKYDLLGSALTILSGIADVATAKKVISGYPHSDKGPPVIWPQQPFIPIYHNRALWPFVTAYWLRAAKRAGHAEAVTHNMRSMIRGAALNLSNMENFEFLQGANYVQDGQYSGPVVNSRRQLWSVAGYISMIQDVLFGLEVSEQGVRFQPFFPRAIRQSWFAQSNELTLRGVVYKGKSFDVTLRLPAKASGTAGAYDVDTVVLNGSDVKGKWLTAAQLQAQNTLIITLSQPANATNDALTIVKNSADFRLFWSPREPSITKIEEDTSGLKLTISNNGEQGVTHDIYRDGVRVATGIAAGTWIDKTAADVAKRSYCYAVDAGFTSSKNRSHHSLPTCYLGKSEVRLKQLSAYRFEAKGGKWGTSGKEETYLQWGDGTDSLEVAAIRPDWTGTYALQILYRNPHGSLTSSIACATKKLQIIDNTDGKVVKEGYVVMPTSQQLSQARSNVLRVDLRSDRTYRLRIENDNIVHNMTYLEHFSLFTGGPGGGTKTFNQVEIQGVRMFPLSGTETTRTTGSLLAFNGNNDLNKYASTQVSTPGVLLETWERFGLDWDQDWLYITIVSKGFEADLKVFTLYVEPAQGSFSAATQSKGVTYLNQTAELPFTPKYMLGVRLRADNSDGFGPWNGVWRKDTNGWVLQTRWRAAKDYFVAGDKHTISYRVHRAELGWPQRIRLAGHLVNGVAANEWKVTVPSNHTPWKASNTGYYEIVLGSQKAVSVWTKK